MQALPEVSCLDALGFSITSGYESERKGDVWTEAFPLPVGFVIPSLLLSGDPDPHADISNGSSPYLTTKRHDKRRLHCAHSTENS